MEWISSSQLMVALGATEPDTRSLSASAVLSRARLGRMRARTNEFFENDEPLGNRVLTKEFWSGVVIFGATRVEPATFELRQNWEFGDFEIIRPEIKTYDDGIVDLVAPKRSNLSSWKALGVEWSKEDAERMGANFRALADPQREASFDAEGQNNNRLVTAVRANQKKATAAVKRMDWQNRAREIWAEHPDYTRTRVSKMICEESPDEHIQSVMRNLKEIDPHLYH